MKGVRADAPWCPWNIEFIRRINGLDTVDDVQRIVFDASYLVLGLGDVYLGAPVATPLDPRHRLVTTKYNPARTWTPENAVGIGGAYLCIYGMEGPGGYQFVGRTVQVWNRDRLRPALRPSRGCCGRSTSCGSTRSSADELLAQREEQRAGTLAHRDRDDHVLAGRPPGVPRRARRRRSRSSGRASAPRSPPSAGRGPPTASRGRRRERAVPVARGLPPGSTAEPAGRRPGVTSPTRSTPRSSGSAPTAGSRSGSRCSTRRRPRSAAADVDRRLGRRRDAAAGRRHAGRQGQHRRGRRADDGRVPGATRSRRRPRRPAVQRLVDAGAVVVGKTNMDQFATGLVGVRSPHGVAPTPTGPA